MGGEGDSAHGLDHTTGGSPSTAGEGQGSVLVVGPEQETGASRWREDKARGVRLHRRVRALARYN